MRKRVRINITKSGDLIIYFDDRFYLRTPEYRLEKLFHALKSCSFIYLGDHPMSYGRCHKYISMEYLMDDTQL
jgi:hypothetical protein